MINLLEKTVTLRQVFEILERVRALYPYDEGKKAIRDAETELAVRFGTTITYYKEG